MSCTHQRKRLVRPSGWGIDNYSGERVWVDAKYETISTTEDIDTGRYRCTQCKQVMYTQNGGKPSMSKASLSKS